MQADASALDASDEYASHCAISWAVVIGVIARAVVGKLIKAKIHRNVRRWAKLIVIEKDLVWQ